MQNYKMKMIKKNLLNNLCKFTYQLRHNLIGLSALLKYKKMSEISNLNPCVCLK